MDERMQFIQEWQSHEESMTVLCGRYGISRKTGYTLVARYDADGRRGLEERSRAPHHQAVAVAPEIARAVLALRATHPRWGPRKLRAGLQRHDAAARGPAASTMGVLLQRHGLTIARRRRRRAVPATQPLHAAVSPNDVWSVDFKGWFRTGDGARCTPLTLTDNASRFLLRCQAVAAGDERHVRPLLEAAFREYGLPGALRSDNGPPFGSVAAGGLSRLAVWWIKLGIAPDRITPGHPEENGRHERLHLTLKQETAAPPQATARAQQRAFDRFREIFNQERPHEALGQQPPATVYTPSPRPYPERLPEIEYAADELIRRVRPTGEIRWRGQLPFITQTLVGDLIGLSEIVEGCWRVRFGPVVLGWFDLRGLHGAVTYKLLPMCPA